MAKKVVFLLVFSLTFIYLLQIKPRSDMPFNSSIYSNMEENNTTPKSAVKEDWSRIWDKGDDIEGHGVAVDEMTGAIYVAGYNQTSNYDIILIKYTSSGDQEWNISWDNGADELAYDVAVDSEGYVYVCGVNGTFGPTNIDMLLLRFNSSGKLEWVRTLDKGYNDGYWGITIDNNDDICMVGDSVDDFFVVKYNKTGHKQWETEYDDLTTYASGRRISHDNLNNLYVAGFNNTNPNSDILLVKFDSLGNQIWNTTWVGEKLDEGTGVAIDSNYNIYVSGITNNTISSTGYDLILLKFDTNGNYIWNRTWGTDIDERRTESGVAVDSTDSVYLAGGLSNDLTALLKYSTSGNLLWNITYNASAVGSYPNHLHDIFIDSLDNIYITGYVFNVGNYDIFIGKFLPDPGAFTVYSNAGYPDTDGRWTLSWTVSIRADNYSLYAGIFVPITEINDSLELVYNQTLTSPINIYFSTDYNGHYYFIMAAYSEYGNMTSNVLHIWVSIVPGDGDDDDDDDDEEEPAIPGYNIWVIIGILTAISAIIYKKRLENSK